MSLSSEQEPLLPGRSDHIGWNGDSIIKLSVHREAPVWSRVDVVPFVFAYTALLSVYLQGLLTNFTAYCFLGLLISSNVLAVLLQYWTVRARVWFSLTSVRAITAGVFGDKKVYVRVIPRAHSGKTELVPLMRSDDDSATIFFDFQKSKYIFNPELKQFDQVQYPTQLCVSNYVQAASRNYTTTKADLDERLFMYGPNLLHMPVPSFSELYIQHLLAPFFVFQVFSVFLWIFEDQWQYSAVTLGMMLMFEATVCHGRLRSLRELRGMRNKPRDMYVFRDRKWVIVSSSNVLPGDIVSVTRSASEADVVPCDVLVLSGSAVVNEAMLTGESVPVVKDAVAMKTEEELNTKLDLTGAHKVNVLFGGTRVLKVDEGETSAVTVGKPPDSGVVCYALRTGFGTSQGQLMTTILYSTETVSANSWEAALFILFLLINAIAASGYVLYNRYSGDAEVRHRLLLRCILIVTSVVPPELPMQLALAVNSSLIALAQYQVFCTEPFRIPYAGKVHVCCFDKTGTLTTDAVNAVGVALPDACAHPDASNIISRTDDSTSDDQKTLIPVVDSNIDAALVLAACHSLVHIGNDIVGDPLELSALEAVQWNFGKTGTCVPKRGGASVATCRIVSRFRFASELKRMSVIVKISGLNSEARVLAKGAPEAIGALLKGHAPPGFEQVAQSLARNGMRVLALAYKDLDGDMTASQLSKLTREEAECDLTFAGFVCFECPLRPDSRKSIRKLRRANLRTVMITGDSALTAAHVANAVGMSTRSVLILEKNPENPSALEWVSASSGKRKRRFDVKKLQELAEDFDLCMPGPVLKEVLENTPVARTMLKHITIFARMAPAQKEDILIALKDAKLITLMCGDGTNDVGALKQAHVGVALLSTCNIDAAPSKENKSAADASSNRSRRSGESSKNPSNVRQRRSGKSNKNAQEKNGAPSRAKTQAEQHTELLEKLQESLNQADSDQAPLVKLGDASVAAPFTSRQMSIEPCISIIRQGRCTLAITLQMYQILALNSLIQAFSLSVLYLEGISFGDKQMTIVGVCMAMAFFMITRSKPVKKLTPDRPPPSIFAPQLFVSLLAQFAVHVAVILKALSIARQYLPEGFEAPLEEKFEPSVFNTIVFLVSVTQQVSVMVVNYKGRPFMEGMAENKGLRISLVSVILIAGVCLLEIIPELNNLMQCAPWPSASLQLQVAGLIGIDFVLAWLVDFFVTCVFRQRV